MAVQACQKTIWTSVGFDRWFTVYPLTFQMTVNRSLHLTVALKLFCARDEVSYLLETLVPIKSRA